MSGQGFQSRFPISASGLRIQSAHPVTVSTVTLQVSAQGLRARGFSSCGLVPVTLLVNTLSNGCAIPRHVRDPGLTQAHAGPQFLE